MSGPTRQRSLRERIQSASRGIGISWQGKKSKSYHSKESLSEAQAESQTVEQDPDARDKGETQSDGANNRTKDQDSLEPVANRDEVATGEKKPLGRSLTQPQGTEQYKVEPSDTLACIAARFDTTPSELAKLNRLAARIVFPGQLLYVPEKRNKDGSETQDAQETTDSLLPPQCDKERRPSVTDALRIPYRRASEKAHRFLKVKARHFTDGKGVVSGVLIITPNAVMFDPNVSDPLVIEHGVESYGVIAPLDMLMRSAIYFDIAHMKVQHAAQQDAGPRPKADVYYGKMVDDPSLSEEMPRPLNESAPSINIASSPKEETPDPEAALSSPPVIMGPSSTEQEQDQSSEPQKLGSEQLTKPAEDVATSLSQNGAPESRSTAPISTSGDSVDSLDAEVSDAFAAAENQPQDTPSESRRERMLKRLSYPMESITSISRILTSSPKSFVDFSGSLFSSGSRSSEEEPLKEENKEEQEEEQQQQQQQQLTDQKEQPKELMGYHNYVEEKPEIFATFDKLVTQKKLREDTEGPPLYLCLRMGIPKEKKLQPSPILSYGKKKARSEYWFSIPHSRVEDLYNFLQQWVSHLYGDVDDVDPDEVGFLPIDDSQFDVEEEEEEEGEKGEKDGEEEEQSEKEAPRSFLKLVEEHFGFKSISPGDWEVLSLGDMDTINYTEMELPLPDLLSESAILEEEHVKTLSNLLPARAVGYPWTLIFSTNNDGFNLKTLYRKMTDFDSPILLAVKDTKNAIFGALLSYPLRPSESFYGTGESFLFTFHPEFKQFKWTGNNDYFVRGNMDSVSIGASDGHFGLWLDGDLYRGTSVCCQTYDNDPLASSADFIVKDLEAWGFA